MAQQQPINFNGKVIRIGGHCMDASRLAHAQIAVELTDERFRPIAGYSGNDAAVIDRDGLDTPVTWPGGAVIPARLGPFRVKLDFRGLRAEDARLYAAYVRDA